MNKRFTTRPTVASDFEKGVQYCGAGMGVIAPGEVAVEEFGSEIDFGLLFTYCFRRFGFPNSGSDSFKEIARYTLTTPMPGLFLTISVKAHNSTSLLFGYKMTRALEDELSAEDQANVQAFHTQFNAWRKEHGLVMPRDSATTGEAPPPAFDWREDSRLMQEYLARYCAEGRADIDALPKGPKTQAVLDAIRATLTDLKTPVAVRDCSFSAVCDDCNDFELDEGDDEDEDEDEDAEEAAETAPRVASGHPSAGYFIPPAYMARPELFVALSEKLSELGGGDLAQGIATFVGKAVPSA